MRRPLLLLLAAALALTGVLLLRAELMTVEVEQPQGSYTDVVLTATVVREDPGVREEMVRGLVSTCRLLVNADVVAESFRAVEPGVFAFRLRPGLDEFERRELRGCLSDLRVQHLRGDVRTLQTVTPEDPAWSPAPPAPLLGPSETPAQHDPQRAAGSGSGRAGQSSSSRLTSSAAM